MAASRFQSAQSSQKVFGCTEMQTNTKTIPSTCKSAVGSFQEIDCISGMEQIPQFKASHPFGYRVSCGDISSNSNESDVHFE